MPDELVIRQPPCTVIARGGQHVELLEDECHALWLQTEHWYVPVYHTFRVFPFSRFPPLLTSQY
jgi:hypothetical protein